MRQRPNNAEARRHTHRRETCVLLFTPGLLGQGKAIDLAKGVIDLSARGPAVERQREPIPASAPSTIR